MSEPLVRELDDVIQQTERNLNALREMASIIVDGQRANDHLLGRLNGLVRYTQDRLVAADDPGLPPQVTTKPGAADWQDDVNPVTTEFRGMPNPPAQESWSETISRLNGDLNKSFVAPPALPPHSIPNGKVATR